MGIVQNGEFIPHCICPLILPPIVFYALVIVIREVFSKKKVCKTEILEMRPCVRLMERLKTVIK